jgi:hypothetical protein
MVITYDAPWYTQVTTITKYSLINVGFIYNLLHGIVNRYRLPGTW